MKVAPCPLPPHPTALATTNMHIAPRTAREC
jgi:hypothetical protein